MNLVYQRIAPDDHKRLEQVYRLRYQVYVKECGYENPDDHPGGIERDKYDLRSVHFGIFDPETDQVFGTVRLILPEGEAPYPVEEFMEIDPSLIPDVPRARTAEVSRLAISKDYRRRLIDRILTSENEVEIPDDNVGNSRRKNFEMQLVNGLFQCLVIESCQRDIRYWYVAMAKELFCLLRRWGVNWKPIGPELDYHGLRSPYGVMVAESLELARKKYPDIVKKPHGWKG